MCGLVALDDNNDEASDRKFDYVAARKKSSIGVL